MNSAKELLREATRHATGDIKAELQDDSVIVTFKSDRSQIISVHLKDNKLRLESVVLGAAHVDKLGRAEALRWCWMRNRGTNVAEFGLDRHGRIIGRTEHFIDSLNSIELDFYIKTLARECDSFEYVLSGEDRN